MSFKALFSDQGEFALEPGSPMAVRQSFLRLGEQPTDLDQVAARVFAVGSNFTGCSGKEGVVGRCAFQQRKVCRDPACGACLGHVAVGSDLRVLVCDSR
jgi:hypothetical protein